MLAQVIAAGDDVWRSNIASDQTKGVVEYRPETPSARRATVRAAGSPRRSTRTTWTPPRTPATPASAPAARAAVADQHRARARHRRRQLRAQREEARQARGGGHAAVGRARLAPDQARADHARGPAHRQRPLERRAGAPHVAGLRPRTRRLGRLPRAAWAWARC